MCVNLNLNKLLSYLLILLLLNNKIIIDSILFFSIFNFKLISFHEEHVHSSYESLINYYF